MRTDEEVGQRVSGYSQGQIRAALARHNVPTELAMIAKLTGVPASRLREFLAGASLDLNEHMTLARAAFAQDEL